MLKTYLRKPVYGVGINDSDYVTQPKDRNNRCPIFDRWHSMVRRCYSKNSHTRNKSYIGVTVCDEWLTFSNFKAWMETQDWQDKALDKDLLGDGTLYSPETCCFLPTEINSAINLKTNKGANMLGASLKFSDGRERPYIAQTMLDGKKVHLGVFRTEAEAHRAWQSSTYAELGRLLSKWENSIVDDAVESLCGIRKRVFQDYVRGDETKSVLDDDKNRIVKYAKQLMLLEE